MNDTAPEIAEMIRVRVMALSGGERMAMAARSFEAARGMVLASISPGLSEGERRRQLFKRLYPELAPPPIGSLKVNTST